LARRYRVEETAPHIDGVVLDLVVDFLTYAVVPLLALWRSGLLEQMLDEVAAEKASPAEYGHLPSCHRSLILSQRRRNKRSRAAAYCAPRRQCARNRCRRSCTMGLRVIAYPGGTV